MQRVKPALSALLTTLLLFSSISFSFNPAVAQTAQGPWDSAANLSNSGSASQPLIAIAPDGTRHTLWWDKFDGTRYVRLAPANSVTATAPTRVVPLPTVLGSRKVEVNAQTNRSTTTITPPVNPRLLIDASPNTRAHLFWQNSLNQLVYALGPGSATNPVWTQPVALAEAVLTSDVQTDAKGALHMAYIRSSDGRTPTPPGLYYRNKAINWLAPTLVFSSTYFRADAPDDVSTMVASDSNGNIVVTWFQARLGQSWYAVSNNAGKNWAAPQPVSGVAESVASQTSVAVAPDGAFLLIWRDANARGCGLTQRKSTDGGQNWSNPEPVLTSLSNCPPKWSFANAEGKLWFVGTAQNAVRTPAGFNSNSVTLANWDGTRWSPPAELTLTAYDTATKRAQTLNCMNVSLAGSNMGGIGCSPSGDVWTATNTSGLDQVIAALKVSWSLPSVVSDRLGNVMPSALATASNGKDVLYAMWAQQEAGSTNTDIYFANWTNQVWARNKVINPPTGRATSLSMAYTPDGKTHVAWNSGRVYYSKSFARDANTRDGWSKAIALPSPNEVTGAPSLIFDAPSNTLYIAFAVPFNEKRGIYLTKSTDGGETWGEPTLVFDAVAPGWESADQPQLVMDPSSSMLHAVWLRTVLPGNPGPRGVFYAQSKDGGQTWSGAVELAKGSVDTPQLVMTGPGQLCVAWSTNRNVANSPTPFEAHYKFSPESGLRWSEDALIVGFDEIGGRVSLASDGTGHMYALAVGQTPAGESALFYANWTGAGWDSREVFGLGQNAMAGGEATSVLLPQTGQLTALLRAPVLNKEGANQFEVVAAERTVTKVELTAMPAFTPEPATPEPTAAPSTQQQPTPTDPPKLLPTAVPEPEPVPGLTQRELILFGALIGVIIMGIAGIAFGFAQSKRR